MTDKMQEEFKKFVPELLKILGRDKKSPALSNNEIKIALFAYGKATAQSEQRIKELETEVERLGNLARQRDGSFQNAVMQASGEVLELRRKLAEQQALLRVVADWIVRGHLVEAEEVARNANKEELTRLLQEAEQRGKLQAFRDGANLARVSSTRNQVADCLDAWADELEGRKV